MLGAHTPAVKRQMTLPASLGARRSAQIHEVTTAEMAARLNITPKTLLKRKARGEALNSQRFTKAAANPTKVG